MTKREIRMLFKGASCYGTVVGLDLVEGNPSLDPTGLTQSVSVASVLEFLGAIFDSPHPIE